MNHAISFQQPNYTAHDSDRLAPQALEHLEQLYRVHINNLFSVHTIKQGSLKNSFNNYMNYAFDILEIQPPDWFSSDPLFKRVISIPEYSEDNQNISLQADQAQTPPLKLPIIKPKSPNSPENRSIKSLMVKIMCNELIELADLEGLNPTKLINLKKILFIKFRRVVETSFAKKIA